MRHSSSSLRLAASLLLTLATAPLAAQPGTGSIWAGFGPWMEPDRNIYYGAFFEITPNHEGAIPAGRLATDSRHRLLALNTWRDTPADTNDDCAVTRHLPEAKTLDMDWTGELEATRRIAFDLGGGNDDRCTAIAVDPSDRPVIVGRAATGSGDGAFVVRLRASDGAHDSSFSGDGKFSLRNLAAFADVPTAFYDVATLPDGRAIACGAVVRGGESNMLVMRWTAGGILDVSFQGTGWREIDWDAGDPDNEECDALELLPDGRIALAGAADGALTGERGYGLVRLAENGDYDPTFGSGGRAWFGDDSAFTEPTVVDLGYDIGRHRLIVAADQQGSGLAQGQLVAVTSSGSLAATFGVGGRRDVRFSDFGQIPSREAGETRLARVLIRRDGKIYVAGTHENSANDAETYGASDIALARYTADGDEDFGAASGFSGDGIAFFGFSHFGHNEVDKESDRLRVSDTLKDAIFYRGNVLLLSQTNRHPAGTWDDETWPLGPVAPLVAGIVTERIHDIDWELEGLPEPTNPYPPIPVPFGYGRYCSVRNASGGGYGLLPQGPDDDPCQVFLDQNPIAIIERAGLYSMTGMNNILAICDGGYIGLHQLAGTAPFDQAFAATAGRTNCIFTASPLALPIFDRPYTGSHIAQSAQSFNHNVERQPLDVTEFGQFPVGGHPLAHFVDLNGNQMCDDTYGHNGNSPCGGVNEAAVDINLASDRDGVAVAPGRVASAVPRYRLIRTPVGTDPYQREVFIRHSVGAGRYAEEFTTYYAHFYDTGVRRGDVVQTGDVLGQVGNNGGSTSEHLHLAVFRHRNLSFRRNFELPYESVDFHYRKDAAAIDPWGWSAPQGMDPAAWRFRVVEGETLNSGAWSINLWKPGEAPTMGSAVCPPPD